MTIISKNKQKVFLNIAVFVSASLLLASVLTRNIVVTVLAVVCALVAQNVYRKIYPRKFKSYKELLQEKYKNNK